MKKTKKNIKQNDEKIQVGSTVVDTLRPVSSLSGSCRGAAFQKKVLTMRKAHSPHEIVFSPDAEDTFFINIEVRKKATGEIRASHYILRSDLSTWISMYEGDNFAVVEQINE